MKFVTDAQAKIFYQVFVNKNLEYEGMFYVGIKTTGIFCRPTCAARKPKFENCVFFNTAQEALLANFRPCMRCYPLSYPGQATSIIQTLLKAVEKNPEKRWKKDDFLALLVDESTVRRHFKQRFGMTFVEYIRARRIGVAMKQIQEGDSVISAQLDTGYESSSGFRAAFTKIIGAAPTKFDKHHNILKSSWIDTQLGPMLAIADEEFLYLLEFDDRQGLEREIERLCIHMNAAIVPGHTKVTQQIEVELQKYFEGALKKFETPIRLLGSPFQKLVWGELMRISYGETRTYSDQARAIGKETAYRAVANANRNNQLAIIIPCHRIINSNGKLGGYSGGINRKKWLITHEREHQHQ